MVFKGSLAIASEFEYMLLIGQLEFISLRKCCVIDTLSKTHNGPVALLSAFAVTVVFAVRRSFTSRLV